MPDLALVIVAVALMAIIVFQVLLWRRKVVIDFSSTIDAVDRSQERTERTLRDTEGNLRDGLTLTLKTQTESQLATLGEMNRAQQGQLAAFRAQMDHLTASNNLKLEELRGSVERKLAGIQEDNAKKLEEMRKTVDENLHGTLDKRLGESFKQVSERLEQVHKGLGEMQTLANGVGDLKKVLSNIKNRGILGEVLLGNLLDQMLAPGQYERDVVVTEGGREKVEYAIRLPGLGGHLDKPVWLPIDSKFPVEDFLRLQDAVEKGDVPAVEEAARQLEKQVFLCARTIRDKYIQPPNTTDFAIMFLPSEGLFAEVLRRPGIVEALQGQFRIIICGPTTLAAILNSLQMGFRSVAIQERSSEVWSLLGAVKTEFGKFAGVLDKVQQNLQAASRNIDAVAQRTRAIDRRLRTVEALPSTEAQSMLGAAEEVDEDDDG